MGGTSEYAWVTSVAGEDQVVKALVLARSLRRVSTGLKTVAITTPYLSRASMVKVAAEFDLVSIHQEEVAVDPGKRRRSSDEIERALKAHGYSLKNLFETCVYLPPTMMVIKNCDALFDKEYSSSHFREDPFNLAAYIFHPTNNSNREFETRQLDSEGGSSGSTSFSNINCVGLEIGLVAEVAVMVGKDGKTIVDSGAPLDGSMVNFVGEHPSDLWAAGVELEQLVNGCGTTLAKLAIATCCSLAMGNHQGGTRSIPSGGGGRYGKREPVAVVGMGFRLPEASTQQELWSLLMEGRDAVKRVPPHRWTSSQTRTHWNRSNSKVEAGFLDVPIDEFDAKFFGLSPKEAEVLDPQQRLLLEVSWEALEEAGMDPLSLRGSRTGIFVGSWKQDYKEHALFAPNFDFFRNYMGSSIASESARLSHFLGCVGPSISIENACSSSIVAVDMAVHSLRRRETNLALAAGVNLILNPFTHKTIEGLLSPNYRCRTFDAKADGFARAEGAATLVLKRLSDALKDGDRIWGLIRGTGIVQEGISKSLGTPTIHCEARAMELALRDAGLDGGGADVDYVEAHGTGTPVGDPLEIAAIAKAYESPTTRTQPLIIGSVKTNIGHTESASGITGIIKVLLSMKHQLIPPHRNLERLNPALNLDAIPAKIPTAALPWPKNPNRRRMAGVSSFGLSGTDGHVILEESPELHQNNVTILKLQGKEEEVERPTHILKLSAKSPESFDLMVAKYQRLLDTSSGGGTRFQDICYSANTGRASFSQRRAVLVAKDDKEALRILKDRSFPTAASANNVVQGSAARICFLFTGQGSQYPGMASELYASSPLFQHHFDRVSRLLQDKYNISVKEALWNSGDGGGGGDGATLLNNNTLYSQASIFAVEYALLKLWEEWGVSPDYVLGHSLGEFAAAVAAGILELEEALHLVVVRSQLISDSLPPGKMLAVKGDEEAASGMVTRFTSSMNPHFWADLAAVNSPEQTVLAGDPELIEDFAQFCSQHGIKSVMLGSSHAFHSRHMDPILDAYGREVASTVLRASIIDNSYANLSRPKYISGVEGRLVHPEELLGVDYWMRHTRDKVNFLDACKTAKEEGVTLFLELGPHPVLSALAMRNLLEGSPGLNNVFLPSLRRNGQDWAVLLDSLGKLFLSDWKGSVNWIGVDLGYSRARVPLPFYPFNRKSVWLPVRPEQPLLHPLIGRILPTAATFLNHVIYENGLLLKNLPYLADHVIGNTVIFPGAGYLEMCLAAGVAASTMGMMRKEVVSKPRRPVCLKGLKILSPMAIQESGERVLQTIASFEQDGSTTIQICRLEESGGGDDDSWVKHAVAKFFPAAAAGVSQREFASSERALVDITSMMRDGEPWAARQFYQKLPELGLKFGPTFQTLEAGWRRGKEMLFKVNPLPPGNIINDESESYLIHPALADGMLQAVLACEREANRTGGGGGRKLQVPVVIGAFVWVRESSNAHQRYIFCGSDDEGDSRASAILIDGNGLPLASMEGVEFVETSVKLVEGLVVAKSSRDFPKTWVEVYKRRRSGSQKSCLDLSESRFEFGAELKAELEGYNNFTEEEEHNYKQLSELARSSFLNSLYGCGWTPQVGQVFSAEDLLTTLGIRQGYVNYVKFFLAHLTEVGTLERVVVIGGGGGGGENVPHFKFSEQPPSRQDVSQAVAVLPTSKESRPEIGVIQEIGKHLKDILTGERDPLSVLFPEERSKPGAAALSYQAVIRIQTLPLRRIMEGVVIPEMRRKGGLALSGGSAVFRVLEVGAGTGSCTRMMLDILRDSGLPFEYYYTDVSTAFFDQAQQEFEAQYNGAEEELKFKRLDMEEDPLRQGFTPEYFDLLYAGEVLHVAKDIRQTLSRLRLLLKPGGLFQILETLIPDPRATFVFGLLPGYWQFQDFELRRDHTTLSGPGWEAALACTGFKDVVVTPTYKGIHGLILAVRNDTDTESGPPSSVVATVHPKSAWIIFGGDDHAEPLSRILEKRLARLHRKVSIFKRGAVRGAEVAVDHSDEHEFKSKASALFEELRGSGLELEGVLFLWGMSGRRGELEVCPDNQTSLSLPFLTICQLLSQLEKNAPKLVAVTRGVLPAADDEDEALVVDPSGGTLPGLIRGIRNENPSLFKMTTLLDLSPQGDSPVTQASQILSTLWAEQQLPPILAFRGGAALEPKLTEWKPPNSEYSQMPVGCTRFQLLLPKTRLISDLEFTFLDPWDDDALLAEDQVEVEVKAVGLNFRDVLTVLKPTPLFDSFSAIGLDVAGVVTKTGAGVKSRKVGDRIFCMNLDERSTMPSHITTKACATLSLPDSMSFAEGATLPAAFFTAYYSLVTVAGLGRGESVLVHTASGGVGLAAIQLARQAGAVIIATAGSPRKRHYLKRRLGVEHVFDSRSLGFREDILKVTGGRGVNVVLNTLTGPGFKEESLAALATAGRFVEISKLNVWNADEVRGLRPDITYHLVDLTTLDQSEHVELTTTLEKLLQRDLIKPLPYERFDGLNIRGALNYMQQAKHIGKIVCVMPELLMGGEGGREPLEFHERTPLFNQHSTYLVAGGLSGIGFEVVRWILRSGGKHVVIASRSHPRPEIGEKIQSWNKSSGSNVKAFRVDVGNYEQCRELIDNATLSTLGFPPLRGVMHCAGVLSDGVLENQSWDKFRQTYNAKVFGSWNLHRLTKHLPLEHFVLFSSIAATFGAPGQSNHSAANSFQDTLANYRVTLGLPATSVNWANWGEVGVATELDFPGLSPIRTAQGIRALEAFLRTQTRRAVVANIESFPLLTTLYPNAREVVDTKISFAGAPPPPTKLWNMEEFWVELDECREREGKLAVFRNMIKAAIRNILRFEASDDGIESDDDFTSLGVDSLMMLELKNGLQNVLGARLTIKASDLKDGNTVAVLAARLLKLLEGSRWQSDEELPSFEELKTLIRQDSILPRDITPDLTSLPPKGIDQVCTILLTGVTGNLGPYLLKELSHRETISKIFCLIRQKGKATPGERLSSALQKFQLTGEVNMSKVEVLVGNICDARFGLEEAEYKALGEHVDAVVHSAVRGDHDAKYWKAPSSNKDNIRTVNILGTLHVLQFCSQTGRPKHLSHASTLAAVGDVSEAGGFSEDWQGVGAFDEMNFNWGYPLTKHVAEQLVRQAVERGLPCKTFRFPLIGGDSRDGRCDHKNSHVLLRWLAVLKLQAMSESLLPLPYIPVDQCARLSLSVFFNPEAGSDVYSMTQVNPGKEMVVLLQVAKEEFGIAVEIVSSEQFLSLIEAEDESSPLAPFRRLYTEDQFARNVHQTMRWLREYNANPNNFFTCEKIGRFLPDFQESLAPSHVCLRRDLRYLRDSGVFQKFGIKFST